MWPAVVILARIQQIWAMPVAKEVAPAPADRALLSLGRRWVKFNSLSWMGIQIGD